MLNNASRVINKRIGLEESDNNFLLAIEPDDDCRFLCEDIDEGKFYGNGDNTIMNFNEDFELFDEATEYDPDLTTSLQDETDADDDMEFDVTNDFESDVDLFKEVDYKDDFEKDYKFDFEPDTKLDKEIDYVDNFDDDADISGFVSVNESYDECGTLDEDDVFMDEDNYFFEDVDINIDSDSDVDVNIGDGEGSDEEISTVSSSSGEVEGLDDEDDDDEDDDDSESVDESFDFFMEDDFYLFENGADATIPNSDDVDDITFDDGQSTDVIEQEDPDDVDAFLDDQDDDSIDLDESDLVEDILM